MTPKYSGWRLGHARRVVVVPTAMVVEAANAARDWRVPRDDLAHRALLIGSRHVAPLTVDWLDIHVHEQTWHAMQGEAQAWARGGAHLGVEVGLLPITKRTGAMLRRVARRHGCTPRALWFAIVHAQVARHAWAFARNEVAA